jgi:hypothetical protein
MTEPSQREFNRKLQHYAKDGLNCSNKHNFHGLAFSVTRWTIYTSPRTRTNGGADTISTQVPTFTKSISFLQPPLLQAPFGPALQNRPLQEIIPLSSTRLWRAAASWSTLPCTEQVTLVVSRLPLIVTDVYVPGVASMLSMKVPQLVHAASDGFTPLMKYYE